jgi:hypothetical protein
MATGENGLWTALGRIPALLIDVGGFTAGLGEIWRALCRIVGRLWRREQRCPRSREDCCLHLTPDVHKRPDPLIYAQYYLMTMGLAVTWDNPDIELFERDPMAPDGLGAPVASSALRPDHPYRVRVRVWNGSYDAPAVGLPVHLSYLSFGAATVSTPIGTRHVDLGVKGSPHAPAFAHFDWRTPGAGHYCLQARLDWADDANPDNNLGQENVQVGELHSPAEFEFTLRNEASVRRRFLIEADTYRLPVLAPCGSAEAPATVVRGQSRLAESRARWEQTRGGQAYGLFPVPANWRVAITPAEIAIPPGEERQIHVAIEPKDPAVRPLMTFNVHAFALNEGGARSLAGGVTLEVRGS